MTVSDLLEQPCINKSDNNKVVTSNKLLINSLFHTCWQLGTSSANTTCWQTCYNMRVFACVWIEIIIAQIICTRVRAWKHKRPFDLFVMMQSHTRVLPSRNNAWSYILRNMWHFQTELTLNSTPLMFVFVLRFLNPQYLSFLKCFWVNFYDPTSIFCLMQEGSLRHIW
jgi:hypothetical protein